MCRLVSGMPLDKLTVCRQSAGNLQEICRKSAGFETVTSSFLIINDSRLIFYTADRQLYCRSPEHWKVWALGSLKVNVSIKGCVGGRGTNQWTSPGNRGQLYVDLPWREILETIFLSRLSLSLSLKRESQLPRRNFWVSYISSSTKLILFIYCNIIWIL